MNYISTRDTKEQKNAISSAMAIKLGLADDGGLFLPDTIPSVSLSDVSDMVSLTYPQRAAKILSLFLTDYSADELSLCAEQAYSEQSFPGGAAPLHKIKDSLFSLELWHGPTSAFKDMALQIMPKLLSRALTKTGEDRRALILVATSGDTGKAALEGYKDADGINIMVFYPEDGVSKVQKMQMASQTGNNVNVCAIKGNFDDAQNGVKAIFSDKDFAKAIDEDGVFFSSANSINWGRLVPQIVYYFSAYCDLLAGGNIQLGDEVNFCVPTGNFGNIFAAYIAKMMGLPIGRLVCASNSNNILYDFFETGRYDRNRAFHTTISPSMDILISSNLERLLYLVCGSEKTKQYMLSLSKNGYYQMDDDDMKKIRATFTGLWADENDTSAAIKSVWENDNYLIDTHTAVAYHCASKYINESSDVRTTVVVSTASPYKFAADVYTSLFGDFDGDGFEALTALSDKTGVSIPYPLADIDKRAVRFSGSVDADKMPEQVLKYIKTF